MDTSASVTPSGTRDITHPGVTFDPRWGGTKPNDWSRQRTQEIRDLRTFERAKKAKELPDAGACLGGPTLLGLVERGKIYPYPLRRPRELWCEESRFRLRDRHFAALAWVTTAWQLRYPGLVIRHRDMATLLGCCERTAGTVMRELADAGLVVATPYFKREGAGHVRWSCIYRLTKGAVSFFGLAGRASKNCQATDTPFSERDPKNGRRSPRGGGDSIAATLGKALQPVATLTGSGSNEPERVNGPTTESRSLAMLRKQLGDHVKRVERDLTRTYQAERARSFALDNRYSTSSSSPGAGGAARECSCVWRLGHLVSPGPCWPRCESHKQEDKDHDHS